MKYFGSYCYAIPKIDLAYGYCDLSNLMVCKILLHIVVSLIRYAVF
jgi:hypothetical protein